jgi:ribosomal protein L16/L10AE
MSEVLNTKSFQVTDLDLSGALRSAGLRHPLPCDALHTRDRPRAHRHRVPDTTRAGNGMGDAGAEALAAAVRSNKSLYVLDCRYNNIAGKAAHTLVGLA